MRIMNTSSFLLLALFCLSLISTSLLGGVVAQEVICGAQGEGALCADGLCCSKWGHCGNTSAYCAPENCQSQCPHNPYQCGEQAGGASCRDGLCCSKWGFCGNTTAYCAEENCQSQCHSIPSLSSGAALQAEGRCGKNFGGALCPDGLCCSYWGYCGKTTAYCGSGCQSQCYDPSKCGWQGETKCSDGSCCSKWGFCGTADAYCAEGNCQSQCPDETLIKLPLST